MSAAAGAGNRNNNNRNNGRDELSRYIKEGYDSFESGYSQEEEFEKIKEKKGYAKKDIFERLEDLGLSKIAVPGDGDCFYYSIEMYLKLTGTKYYDNSGNEIDNISMRNLVADTLLSPDFDPLTIGRTKEWIKKNEIKLRTPGSWNNEIGELPNQILSEILGYRFIIYTMQNKVDYEYEYEYEVNESGNIKVNKEGNPIPKTNNYGQPLKKRNSITNKVKSTKIIGPAYLAQGGLSFDDAKGNIYIVNSGGHYEALIPSSLLANKRVKERVKQLQDYQKQKSKQSMKIAKKIEAEYKARNAEKKAEKRATARATQKKSKPQSNSGSDLEELKKAAIEKEIENALLLMLSLESNNVKPTNVKPKRSSRLTAKKSNAANALKKAAAAGPASSNSNSKPAGGAGKKSKSSTVKKPKRELTKAQQMEYNSWKNQGMNSNTAYKLATAK